jgi:hypothetical protein
MDQEMDTEILGGVPSTPSRSRWWGRLVFLALCLAVIGCLAVTVPLYSLYEQDRQALAACPGAMSRPEVLWKFRHGTSMFRIDMTRSVGPLPPIPIQATLDPNSCEWCITLRGRGLLWTPFGGPPEEITEVYKCIDAVTGEPRSGGGG